MSSSNEKETDARQGQESGEDLFDAAAAEQEAVDACEPVAEGAGAGEVDPMAALEEARRQARESHDRMLRIAAESDNLRKRLERDKEQSLKYAEENILKELLPWLDNLERAMEQGRNTKDIDALLQGVELTLQGLLGALEKVGLKPLDSQGKPFDPSYHEALVMEASQEVPAQHVLQVYEKGYLYKDRLLRAAKVVVSSGCGGTNPA